jgi:hypothetical protein
MKKELSDAEMSRKMEHFRRIIRWRSIFGWLFSGLGLVLFIVGLRNLSNLMLLLNGFLFFGYGLFMVWQAKKAKEKIS